MQDIAASIFGAPVTVPAPLEHVAIGAARQAAWALRSRDGRTDLPDWAADGLVVHSRDDPSAGDRVRSAYAGFREAVNYQ